jgi:hypothetical protein
MNEQSTTPNLCDHVFSLAEALRLAGAEGTKYICVANADADQLQSKLDMSIWARHNGLRSVAESDCVLFVLRSWIDKEKQELDSGRQ